MPVDVSTTMEERRAEGRAQMAAATRATLRPGFEVCVIDLSAGGALVEARRPLRPGARVHVQLVTRGRTFALSAQVLRCVVWALDAQGVLYRGALQFVDRCLSFREPDARDGYAVPCEAARREDGGGAALPAALPRERPSAAKGGD